VARDPACLLTRAPTRRAVQSRRRLIDETADEDNAKAVSKCRRPETRIRRSRKMAGAPRRPGGGVGVGIQQSSEPRRWPVIRSFLANPAWAEPVFERAVSGCETVSKLVNRESICEDRPPPLQTLGRRREHWPALLLADAQGACAQGLWDLRGNKGVYERETSMLGCCCSPGVHRRDEVW